MREGGRRGWIRENNKKKERNIGGKRIGEGSLGIEGHEGYRTQREGVLERKKNHSEMKNI